MTDDLETLDLETRVARKLLQLAEEKGWQGGQALWISQWLNAEPLVFGVTRLAINQVLGWYEDQGIIERRGRRMVIPDPERLRRCAQV
jgi:hypothetical protein